MTGTNFQSQHQHYYGQKNQVHIPDPWEIKIPNSNSTYTSCVRGRQMQEHNGKIYERKGEEGRNTFHFMFAVSRFSFILTVFDHAVR